MAMRVLHINSINHVANLYAEALEAYGYRSTVYQPSMRGGGAAWPIKLAHMPGRVLGLRHIVGKLNPRYYDLAHIHWASYGALGLVAKVPYIVQCHGSDVRERLRNPAVRALLAPVLRSAAAVLCITPDLVPCVAALRPDTTFFPAPLDARLFAPTINKPTGGCRPFTVLLFTRLEPGKGVAASTEGIARFAARHPDVRVLLLDYGPMSNELRSRYGSRFEFVPRVAPDKVHALLDTADVVVGQLAVGALGLSELQAMSCAKPVIASFRYPTAYSEPPPIFEAPDADGVDRQLEYVYHAASAAEAMGARAREWVRAHHDLPVLAARLDALYRSVLGQPARDDVPQWARAAPRSLDQ